MAVYIDNFNAPYGRMKMCHMIADTIGELLMMAEKIGVARKWLQYPKTASVHFDICLSKKKVAIQHGAIEMNARDLVKKMNERNNFMWLAQEGYVEHTEIDKYIGMWYSKKPMYPLQDIDITLPEYLGMTEDEFRLCQNDECTIQELISKRQS